MAFLCEPVLADMGVVLDQQQQRKTSKFFAWRKISGVIGLDQNDIAPLCRLHCLLGYAGIWNQLFLSLQHYFGIVKNYPYIKWFFYVSENQTSHYRNVRLDFPANHQ